MKRTSILFLTILLLNCFLTSCLEVPIEGALEEKLNQQYQDNWDQLIGEVDPNNNWSMATNVTAHIQLSNQVSNQQTVKIYTKAITNSQSRLLAKKVISNNESVSFDILKGSTEVFVRVEDENGNISINDYFPIDSNNEVFVGNKLQGRNASTCSVTKGQCTTININEKTINFYNLDNNPPIQDNIGQWKIGDYSNLFAYYGNNNNNNGLFAEKVNNRNRWQNYIDMEKGVLYKTTESTEISLTYLFGAGWNCNVIGYYYYPSNSEPEVAKAVDRYILIEDGRPHKNLKWGEISFTGNTIVKEYNNKNEINKTRDANNSEKPTTGEPVERMILGNMYNYSDHAESVVQGTEYKLVYFDQNGNSSYTFPEGYTIGFFFFGIETPYSNDTSGNADRPDSKYYTKERLWYSTPQDSRDIHNDYTEKEYQTQLFVTYKYGGTMILGIEDKPRSNNMLQSNQDYNYDYDMNDMLFKLTGKLEQTPIEIYTIDPEEYSWIVACEDLGSTFDTDFNDAVFRLSYNSSGNNNRDLVITPLAAGGTLPIYLYYGENNIGGDNDPEFHTLINEDIKPENGRYPVLHADRKRDENNARTFTIPVPDNFSIANTDFISNFKIRVNQGNDSYFINNEGIKEGKAPQMLFLPEDWRWPKELKSILSAYPNFSAWTQNSSVLNWMNNYAVEMVVEDYQQQ